MSGRIKPDEGQRRVDNIRGEMEEEDTLSVGVNAEKQREREIGRLSMGAEKKEERADARRQKIAASDGATVEREGGLKCKTRPSSVSAREEK